MLEVGPDAVAQGVHLVHVTVAGVLEAFGSVPHESAAPGDRFTDPPAGVGTMGR